MATSARVSPIQIWVNPIFVMIGALLVQVFLYAAAGESNPFRINRRLQSRGSLVRFITSIKLQVPGFCSMTSTYRRSSLVEPVAVLASKLETGIIYKKYLSLRTRQPVSLENSTLCGTSQGKAETGKNVVIGAISSLLSEFVPCCTPLCRQQDFMLMSEMHFQRHLASRHVNKIAICSHLFLMCELATQLLGSSLLLLLLSLFST